MKQPIRMSKISNSSPGALLLVVATACFCVFILVFTIAALYEEQRVEYDTPDNPLSSEFDRFPVSVNPNTKQVIEDPLIDWYVRQHLSIEPRELDRENKIERLLSAVIYSGVFQQFASPLMRTLVIYPGERREEVVKQFGDILRWNNEQRETFARLVTSEYPVMVDGKFFPGKYVVSKVATPEEVATLVYERFSAEILDRYDDTVAAKVPLEQALNIAALLQREAYDFNDMRYISGVIWNRLFIDMPLQLDATLQYVRGSRLTERAWWPIVRPADKFIDSPYNTYQVRGLPPAPIANPSLAAVVAALNPRPTECYFYFHTDDGTFYCSETYEEHVAKLKELYGRGS
jgi:cell division protein YceG involved in septum cleavage